MPRAYVALGSNVGDRVAYLNAALTALSKSTGVRLLEHSSFHETDPVGGPTGQGPYLNAAAAIDTALTPPELLQLLLDTEQAQGRTRSLKNAPRTLDLDLLLYGDTIRNISDPILPHPRMRERMFVLAPLAEIAPEAIDPVTKSQVRELLQDLRGVSRLPFRLDGARVLVTGSTKGIGRATALAMAKLGADVLVHGRDEAGARLVRDAIRALGRRSDYLLADLSDFEKSIELADSAWIHWNGIDVVANVAGADVLTGAMKDWNFLDKLHALWTVDVLATIMLSRWFGSRMKDHGRGVIINVGWDQAETGMDGPSGQLFGATKGAVMAFTMSLAKTVAPAVRVNCVAPGWIKTAWGETASDEWQLRVLRETPLSRWGTPEDVAGAICWLASPAAAFVTGQTIRVNGGAT